MVGLLDFFEGEGFALLEVGGEGLEAVEAVGRGRHCASRLGVVSWFSLSLMVRIRLINATVWFSRTEFERSKKETRRAELGDGGASREEKRGEEDVSQGPPDVVWWWVAAARDKAAPPSAFGSIISLGFVPWIQWSVCPGRDPQSPGKGIDLAPFCG